MVLGLKSRSQCCLKTHVNATTTHVTLSTQPPSLTCNEATLTQNHSFCFLLAAATCPAILCRCLDSCVVSLQPPCQPFPTTVSPSGAQRTRQATFLKPLLMWLGLMLLSPPQISVIEPTPSPAQSYRCCTVEAACVQDRFSEQGVYAQSDCCVHSFGDFQVPRPFEDSYQWFNDLLYSNTRHHGASVLPNKERTSMMWHKIFQVRSCIHDIQYQYYSFYWFLLREDNPSPPCVCMCECTPNMFIQSST